jgi:Co/Zn/Cd efflux system component
MALAANLTSVLLLMRYKDGDANVRSIWLCSRNDAIGNVVVMVPPWEYGASASSWPDFAVAAMMAGIFYGKLGGYIGRPRAHDYVV